MKKYWNALLYGNAKTKRILITVILLFLFAIISIVMAATGAGAIWFLFAIFALIANMVIMQSVKFGDVEYRDKKEGKDKEQDAIRNKTFAKMSDITEADVKALLISYKVTKNHVPVMIDSYAEEKISQQPAYMWKDKGFLQMLVLGEKPKNIAIPLLKVDKIEYKNNVEVSPTNEYAELRQPSMMSMMFQEYMPTYAERRRQNGRGYYVKNLYVLAPGIELTNTSARNVMKLLGLPIDFDNVIDQKYGAYYKEAYRMKILLMDRVYTADEFKEQISSLLKQMADTQQSDSVFMEDLGNMIRSRLVTDEVAQYFIEYRQRTKTE